MIQIKELREAAIKVRKNIKDYIGNSKSLHKIGAGGDEIEQIDKIAEDTVLNYLKQKGHSFTFISEEIGEIDVGRNPECIIILDPIDGSSNASRGLPYFCISIAIAITRELGSLRSGLVMNLVTGQVYHARKNEGAWRENVRLHVAEGRSLENALISTNFSMQKIGYQFEKLKELFSSVKKVRVFGSSALDLCHVATGGIDAFLDLRGKLRTVDIAAGKIMVEEAGGIVCNEKGKSLDNLDVSISTRTSICAFGPGLKDAILKRLGIVG
ncbi:MAG: inositol monophosphatase family protein [Candidatus Helarchaeales archaeon]